MASTLAPEFSPCCCVRSGRCRFQTRPSPPGRSPQCPADWRHPHLHPNSESRRHLLEALVGDVHMIEDGVDGIGNRVRHIGGGAIGLEADLAGRFLAALVSPVFGVAMRAGMPIMVAPLGTCLTTTALEPILAPSPTLMGPISLRRPHHHVVAQRRDGACLSSIRCRPG